MAARSIASLTVSFGLVSIPVRLYSATESSTAVKFNLLAPDGSRVKQQYISEKDQSVVPRSAMIKGYEFEKDRFVLFTSDELKVLEERSSPAIDIVAFVPEKSIDPIWYDKAYLLAPDKRGGKPYALLAAALRASHRCALARWAWKSRRHVVQIRAAEQGLVLQQLLFADEVRSHKDLEIESVAVTEPELRLALELVEQNATESYDASLFHDDEKKRILEAIDRKIAGQQVVVSAQADATPGGGQVIDLMEALRASLRGKAAAAAAPVVAPESVAAAGPDAAERGSAVHTVHKAARRAPVPAAAQRAEPKSRARK